MTLQEGDIAPAFALPDQHGTIHRLSDYEGKWVLMYFYPKDDTPGCTTEACGIRDNWREFEKHGLIVLGISTDTVKSHQKFAEKYDLPFTLLADEQKEVVNLYGVWGKKKFMGKEYMGTLRNSYLINPKGVIAKIYENVKPPKHAQAILRDMEKMQK